MNKKMTPKQNAIFNFISSFIKENSYPPSYADIATHFNYSTVAAVQSHLDLIEKKGYIRRSGKARSIQILKPNLTTDIPIVGSIAAGQPIAAIENMEGSIGDISELQQSKGKIALRVRGDSMIGANIADGDIAIVQTKAQIYSGDIAAVLLESEATLKRIEFQTDKVLLKAENPAYSPIQITPATLEARIIGKYIALIRVA